MSFALTTEQIEKQTKSVTRRLGWRDLKVGERLLAVDKQRVPDVKKLAVIEVVSVRREPLNDIGIDDVEREGFLGMTSAEFVEMFCREMECKSTDEVTRIEFCYVFAIEDCTELFV